MYCKRGIDYFSLPCNEEAQMRSLRRRFGLVGAGVVVELYRIIYRDFGYYAPWNDECAREFSWSYGVRVEKASSIVGAACELGIFDAGMLEKYGILTSREIQEYYFSAVSRRSRVEAIRNFLLVDPLDCLKRKWYVADENCLPCVDDSGENVNILRSNDGNSPQRKEKKQKRKEESGLSARARVGESGSFGKSGASGAPGVSASGELSSFDTEEFFTLALKRSFGARDEDATPHPPQAVPLPPRGKALLPEGEGFATRGGRLIQPCARMRSNTRVCVKGLGAKN